LKFQGFKVFKVPFFYNIGQSFHLLCDQNHGKLVCLGI
jgi:hypothetical protein